MMRFILALLAVLSGIAAIGQPVSARVCAAQAQAMQHADCAVEAHNAGCVKASLIPTNTAPDMRRAGLTARPTSAAAFAPAVRMRCDRALE